MRSVRAQLAERRAALVARCAEERAGAGAAFARLRQDVAEPLALGLGAALALAGSSPRLRAWLVRAWVAGALLRRLLAR
jgi:hypothetical protein